MLDQLLLWLVLVIPVFLGLVVILVPAKHEDEKGHMRWRYALGVLLILYGGLAWIQQSRAAKSSTVDREKAIKDTAAETSATVSKTVGQQYEDMITDLTMQIQSLRDQLANQSKSFAIQLKQTETDVNGNISKVGTAPVKYAQLQFMIFDVESPTPRTSQTIGPDDNGIYTLDFTAKNISDTAAVSPEIWVHLCDHCVFAEEPSGFDRPQGLEEHSRHKQFQILNPGVSMEKMTLKFKIVGGPFRYADIGFDYSCASCGKMTDVQTIRNFILPPLHNRFN